MSVKIQDSLQYSCRFGAVNKLCITSLMMFCVTVSPANSGRHRPGAVTQLRGTRTFFLISFATVRELKKMWYAFKWNNCVDDSLLMGEPGVYVRYRCKLIIVKNIHYRGCSKKIYSYLLFDIRRFAIQGWHYTGFYSIENILDLAVFLTYASSGYTYECFILILNLMLYSINLWYIVLTKSDVLFTQIRPQNVHLPGNIIQNMFGQ